MDIWTIIVVGFLAGFFSGALIAFISYLINRR